MIKPAINKIFEHIPEIIEWVKEKKLKKLSKINLKLFLSEKKMDLAPPTFSYFRMWAVRISLVKVIQRLQDIQLLFLNNCFYTV